ncbi:MAG: hypothetical protein V4487_00170 [Chlamydiota bacterium]
MLLEKEIRLSQSILWRLQESAYKQFGLDSWTRKGVPLHVTSNRQIARQYAQIALNALQNSPSLNFLELGGGCGRFAYLFLGELLAKTKKPVRYFLTDLAEKNVVFWKEHPLFRPYLDQGLLQLAVYNPLDGRLPSSASVFVLANYFFDSIAQDLFQIREGQLFEGRVTLHSKMGNIDDPNILGYVQAKYCYHPVSLPYYHKPSWDALLQEYLEEFSRATFLLPVGALQVFENLPSFHLLAADKGYCTAAQIKNWQDPDLNLHGTISFPVNFHLLGKFLKNRGGEALFSSPPNPLLSVALFASCQMDPTLCQAFQSESFTPILKEPEVDALFFPLCREEALRFYDLPGKDAPRLANLCQTLPSAERKPVFQPKGRVLQIGLANSGFLAKNLEVLSLGQVRSWPLLDQIFDEIYFFAPTTKIAPTSRSLLVQEGKKLLQEIDKQFPELKQMVYSDEEIEIFFQSPKAFSTSAQYIQFFSDLHERKQINGEQKSAALIRLEKEGLITSADLQQDSSFCKGEEVFSLFREAVRRCLEAHMKEGSCILAYFPGIESLYERAAQRNPGPSGSGQASSLSIRGKELAALYRSGESPSLQEGVLQVEGFVAEIVANPWIEYSEEFCLETQMLCAKISVLGS